MGITAYIIIIGLVVLIAIPFITSHLKNSKRDKELTAALNRAASEGNLTLSLTDTWNGIYAIGIDREKPAVIYINKNGEKVQEVLADLNGAEECRMDVVSRTEKTPNGSLTVIEAISLVISYRDKTRKDKWLEFYNNEIHHSLGGEKGRAEKWQQTILPLLKKRERP